MAIASVASAASASRRRPHLAGPGAGASASCHQRAPSVTRSEVGDRLGPRRSVARRSAHRSRPRHAPFVARPVDLVALPGRVDVAPTAGPCSWGERRALVARRRIGPGLRSRSALVVRTRRGAPVRVARVAGPAEGRRPGRSRPGCAGGAPGADRPLRACARPTGGRPVCPALLPPNVTGRPPLRPPPALPEADAGGATVVVLAAPGAPGLAGRPGPLHCRAPPDDAPTCCSPPFAPPYGHSAPPLREDGRPAPPPTPLPRHRPSHRPRRSRNHPHAPDEARLFGARNSGHQVF